MPVTEIATLALNPPHTWDSPDIQTFFTAVATQQAAWSGYALHYFQDTVDPRVVYILTGWESVPAHIKWIESEQNQALLMRAKGLIEVKGLQHARLESKLDGVEFVALEQWTRGQNEELADDVGIVEETPGRVCRIRVVAEREIQARECSGIQVLCMKRLKLSLQDV